MKVLRALWCVGIFAVLAVTAFFCTVLEMEVRE